MCRLPIRGRAKVRLQAKAGATITTFVYINDDDKDSSLLGERDALRLGIVKINLHGSEEEVMVGVDGGQEEGTEKMRRIRQNRLSELAKGKKITKEVEENRVAMDKLADEFTDIFGGVGKYKGPAIKIQLRENISPVIQPRRRIPLHYVKPLEDHLKELLEEDVIEGPLVEEEEGT